MIRYVLVLLLIDGYGRGLGNPMPNTNNGNIADSLLELAKYCESPVLSTIINEKRMECNISAQQPQNEEEFQCLLFYDINRQLCSGVSNDKIIVQENEYKTKINEKGNITQICSAAKDWILDELPEYSFFKPALTKILTKEVTCLKFCASPGLFDEGVNFYCKYYDWGYDKLKSQSPELTLNDPKVNAPSIPIDPVASHPSKAPEKPLPPNIMKAPQIVNNSGNQSKAQEIKPIPTDQVTNKNVVEIKPDVPSVGDNDRPASTSKKAPPVEDEDKVDIEHGKDGLPQNAETEDKNEDVVVSNAGEEPLVETEVEKPGTDGKKEMIPKLKPINQEPDDYQDPDNLDSEEMKDDIQNQDDPEDSIVEEKPNQTKIKQSTNTVKRIETPIASIEGQSSQRDILPNMPDYPDDDDENFYAIFLTAVVLLILLYVIYHNKSKVTKVVLGLIVEGRQTGRRRDSRGHAYRRLDTLEQAMNTNTAAAPSKIIY